MDGAVVVPEAAGNPLSGTRQDTHAALTPAKAPSQPGDDTPISEVCSTLS